MIGLLLAALVQPTTTADVRGARIEIPPAISRQVIPYMNCTLRRSNSDSRMPTGDVAILRAINADARAACAEIRRRGTTEADRILKRDPRHRDAAGRLAFINRAFEQVDQAADALAATLERMSAGFAKPPKKD